MLNRQIIISLIQGDKVRELKAAKSEKSVIDAEVLILKQLKQQLALAEGQNPDQKQKSSASTGKILTTLQLSYGQRCGVLVQSELHVWHKSEYLCS